MAEPTRLQNVATQPQARFAVSSASNSYFLFENPGDVLVHPGQSNQRILIGNTSGVAPLLAVASNNARVGGDFAALNVAANQVVSTGIHLSMYNAVEEDSYIRVVAPGADFAAVSQHIIPQADGIYDLGASNLRFRDLHLSSNSLYVDGVQVSIQRDPVTGLPEFKLTDTASNGAPPDAAIVFDKATSNAAYFSCNAAVASSNALFPQATFSSNTAVVGSNVAYTTSNAYFSGAGMTGFFYRNMATASNYFGIGSNPGVPLDVLLTAPGGSNLSIRAAGDIAALSDLRIKTDLRVIDSAVSRVNQINGYTYQRVGSLPTHKRMAGVIAQEVQEVLPEVVYENGETGYLSVSYGNMVALLIEAVKELDAKVKAVAAHVGMPA